MPNLSFVSPPSAADLQEIYQQIYRAAYEKFLKAPHWVEFYRYVFGIGGIVRQALPLPQDRLEFQKTQEYIKIQRMLAKLRKGSAPLHEEKTKVITVRIPKSLHQALIHEADEYHLSLNKYCISKLLQLLDPRIFPPPNESQQEEEEEEI